MDPHRILEQLRVNAMRQAAELMAWRGYDNVRASELAKVARMSVGSLYRQYGNKRGFALAVRAFTEDSLCCKAQSEFQWARSEPGASFRHAFLVLWEELALFAMQQPALFSFTFLHWHPEDMQQQAGGTQVRALLREVLSEGEREGVLAPGSSRTGGFLVWGLLVDLVRAVAHGAAEELEPGEHYEMGEALWRAMAAHEDPGPEKVALLTQARRSPRQPPPAVVWQHWRMRTAA